MPNETKTETKTEIKTETNEEWYNKVNRDIQKLDTIDKSEINEKCNNAFEELLEKNPHLRAIIEQTIEDFKLNQSGNDTDLNKVYLVSNSINKVRTKENKLRTKKNNLGAPKNNLGTEGKGDVLDVLDEGKENIIKSDVINRCYNILKTQYKFKKSEDGTLQFKKRDDSSQVWISAGADGVIEQFEDEFKEDIKNKNNLTPDAVNKMWNKWLSNENDENDGNTFKDSIYEELLSNALDENDIEIVEGLIAKYKFKKSEDGTLQFKDRNNPSQQWTSIDVDGIKSIEGIGDQNKDKIYQELLDSALDENDAKIIDELTTKYTFKKSEDGNLKFKDRDSSSQNWIFFTIDSVDEIADGIGDQNKDKIYQELLNSALDENDD